MHNWKNNAAQNKNSLGKLSHAVSHGSQAHTKPIFLLWHKETKIDLCKETGLLLHWRPSIHTSTHPARHQFPWQVCCSLWQAYWQAGEELGIMGLEDDTSACGGLDRTHLCGMHGIHVAAPRQLFDENQWNQWHLWTCNVAACFLFICLATRVDVWESI